ncbi:Penicillin acylase precursor [Serratia quinivorans]|uniref:linear amide C-N hydrolase n=1 Tax=Serratia quinivorans TaxID=137545 RepID=UPI00217778D4|nr:linear amide C-N hydrolase [Serratia quinivorans]CAI1853799.1 Penicillin acylase precursor [Serratia quinivorans]
MQTVRFLLLMLATLCIFIVRGWASGVHACTRILWNSGRTGILVGRTIDWTESTDPILLIFPRGRHRYGGLHGNNTAVENPAIWTSKYASLVTSIYGVGAIDGFNEKGLGAHLLYLNATQYPFRTPAVPGLQVGLWAQYVLDNAATVEEALTALENVQVVMIAAQGHKAALHLVLEDAQGDSAIVEYLNGKMYVHHSKTWTVVTNDPDYDTQLSLLKNIDMTHPDSALPLSGNVSPTARFTRATYFSHLLKTPAYSNMAISKLLSVLRNVSVPYDAPYKGVGTYATEYRTIIDLTQRKYIFELTSGLEIHNMDLMIFRLGKGSPVMDLDPRKSGNTFTQTSHRYF